MHDSLLLFTYLKEQLAEYINGKKYFPAIRAAAKRAMLMVEKYEDLVLDSTLSGVSIR
jgi:hypothetical protein